MIDRVEEIANELIGTRQSLVDVAEPHELEDFSFEEQLRDHALQCGSCRIWDSPECMDTTGREPECEDCCGGA